jgi:hypothetical protein
MKGKDAEYVVNVDEISSTSFRHLRYAVTADTDTRYFIA